MTQLPFGAISPPAIVSANPSIRPTGHGFTHTEPASPEHSLRAFLFFLAGLGQIHLTAIHEHDGILSQDFAVDAAKAEHWASYLNAAEYNLYWAVNEVRGGLCKKAALTDIVKARFCHVDLDPPKDGSLFDKSESIRRLVALAIPPTLIIDSGNGLQAFWQLAEFTSEFPIIEGLNRSISARFGGDNCHDLARVMRLPGTVNWPNATKRARGCVPVQASVVS